MLRPVVRLNLGCGNDLRPGYVNVDKFPCSDDVLAADFPTLPFPSNHADEVLLCHVLEHFGYAEGIELLKQIHRVLKPGGIAQIEVPDIAWCCAQFLGAPEPNGFTDPFNDYGTSHKWGMWAQAIWGDQIHDGLYHKWGYTAHRLLHTLRHVGFPAIDIHYTMNRQVQCLVARAQKAAQ